MMRTLRMGNQMALALFLVLHTANPEGQANGDKTAEYTLQFEPAAVDAEIRRSLHQITNEGAAKFNNGDPAGCCNLFHSALRSAQPRLPHHPKLQRAIKDGLAEADQIASPTDRAFKLRAVLDKVREDLKASERRGPK